MKTIVIAAIALSALAAPAFAQSTSGTVAVAGAVPSFCDMTVNAANTALNIVDNVPKSQTIGAMNLHCNSATGFSVVPSTTNGFKLTNPNTPSTVGYKLRADGQAGPSEMPAGQGLNYGPNGNTAAATTAAGFNAGIYLDTFASTGALYAGTYSDTITLTISAN